MKCLTVRQPWACAVAHGGKNIENRTWATGYRGSLAIHAGAAWDTDAATNPIVIEAALNYGPDLRRTDRAFVYGAVLAIVDLIDICTARLTPGVTCDCGPWAMDGNAHWKLANPQPLDEPVPCKGRLGLWDLTPAVADGPSEVERAVLAQIGATA